MEEIMQGMIKDMIEKVTNEKGLIMIKNFVAGILKTQEQINKGRNIKQ